MRKSGGKGSKGMAPGMKSSGPVRTTMKNPFGGKRMTKRGGRGR